MGLSIRTKLVLAIGVPLLATYLGMIGCEYHLGKRQVLDNMEAHLTELAARQAAELNGELAAAEELARSLALAITSVPDLTADQFRALLQDSLRTNPKVFGMCVAFERGAFSPSLPGFAPYYCRASGVGLRYVDIAATFPNYSDLDWYRPAKVSRRPFWTEPYFDTGVGERIMCTFTAPIFREGRFRGVVTVDVLSDDLLRDIARIKTGAGYCMLISNRGTIISHPDPSLVMRESIFSLADRRRLPELADAGRQMVARQTGVRRVCDYRSGQPDWMVYAPVESTGWSLAAVIPEREVLAPVYARLLRFLGILGAGLVVILGIVGLVSARVTRPLGKLVAATRSLGRGNLDACVADVPGRDEVAQLADTFNTMVADLRTNVQARIREETTRREVEGELRAAREIQTSLLPGMLPHEREKGFALHAVNAPAKLVAGDFYDFFFVDDARLALVMADVSGKGVPAAIYMAMARTKLRDFAAPNKTPAQVVAEVNRCLSKDNEGGMFLTVFFGYYDTTTGTLIYANAGHNPPYLVRSGGKLETLDPTGPLVAPFPDAVFQNAQCSLEQDDLLLLFTDGVTEAGADKGLFGEERLEGMLQKSRWASPADVCESIICAVREFSRGDLRDDATIMALKCLCREESLAQATAVL